MRPTLTHWLPGTLTLVAALACADAPTATPSARPSASRAALGAPDVRRAAVRVLSVAELDSLRDPVHARSEAWRINDDAQVIGASGGVGDLWSFESYTVTGGRAVLWQAGGMTDLNARIGLAGSSLLATGISNRRSAGTVSLYDASAGRSVLWNGIVSPLDPLPFRCRRPVATDVNDAGKVVGYASCEDTGLQAIVWSWGSGWQVPFKTGSPTDTQLFPGFFAVNAAGIVVGAASTFEAVPRLLPLVDPRVGDGEPAGGLIECRPGCWGGWARDVNDRNWVVGMLDLGAGEHSAFLWTRYGGIERIPPLPGDANGAAFGIDNWNRVVGFSWGADGKPHAFVWTRRDGTQPLGALPGAEASKAYGINDRGQVVGSSGTYLQPGGAFSLAVATRATIWQLDSPILGLQLDAQPLSLSFLGNARVLITPPSGMDPMSIDARSLRLGDEIGVDTPPATDAKGNPIAYAKDANGDGRMDLVVEFSVPALVKNGDLGKATTELLLTGTTAQGTSIMGLTKVAVAP